MQWMTFFGPTFTLEMPTDWFAGASIQFQAVLRSAATDGALHPNLAVAIRTLEEGASLKEVLAVAQQTQEKEYPNYKLLGESPVMVSTVPGRRRRFEWQPPERDVTVQQQQLSFLNGRQLYTLTTTRAAASENVEEIDRLFERMLGSFEFRTSVPDLSASTKG